VVLWDRASIHHSHTIQEVLANGAPQRICLERFPAEAPALPPGKGRWRRNRGLERHNVGYFTIPQQRLQLDDLVKRFQRILRILQALYCGAKGRIFMTGSGIVN
jgi:hypothetical protein